MADNTPARTLYVGFITARLSMTTVQRQVWAGLLSVVLVQSFVHICLNIKHINTVTQYSFCF